MQEKIVKLFNFWAVSERLKDVKRWKGVSQMKEKETSADHSWHLAAFAFVVIKEFGLNFEELKCLKLALVHDLVEAIAGDIDSVLVHSGKADQAEKERKEKEAILEIVKILPKKSGKEIKDLWFEYEKRTSLEAKFIYTLDKMESVGHMVSLGHKSFHEYADFIALYCHVPVNNSFSELKPLHFALQKKLKDEFKKHGWEWKKEYNVEAASAESMEKAERILNFIKFGEQFKKVRRYSTVEMMPEKESSAEHSWHLALMAFVLVSEINFNLDELKLIKLALFHDLPEAITGDINYSLIYFGKKTKEKKNIEELEAIREIRKNTGERTGQNVFDIWTEYEDGYTREALFVKALDKVESINHILNKGYGYFDYPELIAPYPNNAVKKFPELKPVLKELQDRLKPEYEKRGWEWLEEYFI